jgi:hypothetical protein
VKSLKNGIMTFERIFGLMVETVIKNHRNQSFTSSCEEQNRIMGLSEKNPTISVWINDQPLSSEGNPTVVYITLGKNASLHIVFVRFCFSQKV